MTEHTKEQLQALAQEGVVKFVFRKKDNSLRTLIGTLHPSRLPPPTPEAGKRPYTPNPSVFTVYDLENEGWRGFHPEQLVEAPTMLEELA